MSNPIEELGAAFDNHMKRIVGGNQSLCVELGTINADFSLTVGSLSNAIPKGDYMLPLRLTITEEELIRETTAVGLKTGGATISAPTESVGNHTHSIGAHKHEVELPEQFRPLRAGDRVLVAWVGTEPVVVDILKSS